MHGATGAEWEIWRVGYPLGEQTGRVGALDRLRSGLGGRQGCVRRTTPGADSRVPLSFTELPLASEIWPHFGRPSSRTCSTGELSGAATRQEVLLAVAVAVETSEKAAVDASRSFLKPASERTRRPSLALPLASEVIL